MEDDVEIHSLEKIEENYNRNDNVTISDHRNEQFSNEKINQKISHNVAISDENDHLEEKFISRNVEFLKKETETNTNNYSMDIEMLSCKDSHNSSMGHFCEDENISIENDQLDKDVNNKIEQKLIEDLVLVLTDLLIHEKDCSHECDFSLNEEEKESSNFLKVENNSKESIEFEKQQFKSQLEANTFSRNHSKCFDSDFVPFANVMTHSDNILHVGKKVNHRVSGRKTSQAEKNAKITRQNSKTKNEKNIFASQKLISDDDKGSQIEKSEQDQSPSVIFLSKDSKSKFRVGDHILTIDTEKVDSTNFKSRDLSLMAINVQPDSDTSNSGYCAKFKISQLSPEYEWDENPRPLEDIIRPLSSRNTNVILVSPSKFESESESSNVKVPVKSKVQPKQFISPNKKSSLVFRMQDIMSQVLETDAQPTVIAVSAKEQSKDDYYSRTESGISTVLIASGKEELSKQIKHMKNPEEKKWSKLAEETIQTLPPSVKNKPIVFIFPPSYDDLNKFHKDATNEKTQPIVFIPQTSQFSKREIIEGEVSEGFCTDDNQAIRPTIVILPSKSNHTVVEVDCWEPFEVSARTPSYSSTQKVVLEDSAQPHTQKQQQHSTLDQPMLLMAGSHRSEVTQQKDIRSHADNASFQKTNRKSLNVSKTKKYALSDHGKDICYHGHEKCDKIHLNARVIVEAPKKDKSRKLQSSDKMEGNLQSQFPIIKTNKKGMKICYYGHEECEDIHIPSHIIVTAPEYGREKGLTENSNSETESKRRHEVNFDEDLSDKSTSSTNFVKESATTTATAVTKNSKFDTEKKGWLNRNWFSSK
ncbi:uncharacterized protein LOC111617890 [Centruroides sculpturatus]|uniref:uncharacterized protein LOC111617890 n=1 Tax=Centruroides sculpturatus TaxID=218467 RepID=UPI000C6E1BDE|nr:uncharacterized protein LOC111617890 [Centruroides sculpturatus]XP_023215007.1 uncharacterized protein LOC111617890 [Centruroides sculpturatus]